MPRKTHVDSLETKMGILASAQRLFTRRGYERTSLSDIAKYAGYTRGAIYWHFENKEDLFISLLEHLDQEQFSSGLLAQAVNPQESDPLGKFKAWMKVAYTEESLKFINSAFFNVVSELIFAKNTNEALIKKLENLRRERRKMLANLLKNAVNKGQLPQNLAVDMAAELLSIFIAGQFHEARGELLPNVYKNVDFTIELILTNLKGITKDKIQS